MIIVVIVRMGMVGPTIATRVVGLMIAGIVMRVIIIVMRVVVDTNAMRPNRNANLS